MTMSENEIQSPQTTQESVKSVTENGVSCGQEVNKAKDPADGGGSILEKTDPDSVGGETFQPNEQPAAQQKARRCISFPKDSYVSGYCDPPDPWRQAPKVTAQDVLAAYRKSCEKHGTKPLNKVLQQIEALACNGKRAEKLVLKGEKMDTKQCEPFEEILRRIQFKSIDLEACHLDDESAVAWFDMIEFYESACHLNISFNKNIGVRGWQSCSRLIRRTPCLTTLDLRNCDMNDRSIPLFGRALKLGSHLTILHMENMYLSGRSLILLVAALKMNEILQELFLADNRLMPSDGIQLGNLLKYNHSLTLLDLRNNHLQDVGVGHVCDGLYEQNLDKGLRTLVLWNNQVTYQAMASLSRSLGSTKCLETLNLGHNNVTNEGIHILKDGLLKSKSLMRLGLQATKLTCEGAVALAEYVADSLHLLRLDLRENDIKTAGLMALSLSLKVNESVTRLDIDKETKKESGMKDYAEQQRRLQQEIQGYMERNQQRVLEREEEERRQLEERAQVEMAARASVQSVITSAQEAIQAHPQMVYVPPPTPEPEEKPRPSLLFQAHRLTPQESLESPHSPDVNLFSGKLGDSQKIVTATSGTVSSPPLTLALSNPLTDQPPTAASPSTSDGVGMTGPLSQPLISRLRSPPSELLLSPQYYPKPTARKIFSVSRVVETSVASPTVSKTGVLDTGATGASTTPSMKLSGGGGPTGIGGVPSPISPTLLCQDLSTKTVNDYIQQIVADPELPLSETDFHEEESAPIEGGLFIENPLHRDMNAEEDNETLEKPTGFSVAEEEEEEEGGGENLDPLGVMQVEEFSSSGSGASSLMCDNVVDNANCDGEPGCDSEGDIPQSGAAPDKDFVNKVTEPPTQTLPDMVSTQPNSNLHNIPQSSESQPSADSSTSSQQTTASCDSQPQSLTNTSTSSVGEVISPSQLKGAEEKTEAVDMKNSSSTIRVQASQSSAILPDPEPSPLFKTEELPDFEMNDEDLSLFGATSNKATPAASTQDPPKSGSEGREVSPSLGDAWTEVDVTGLGEQEEREEGEKQPDFFTSLSMNGLTQELASVLNSIDGKLELDAQENQNVSSETDAPRETEDEEEKQSTA